MRALAVILCIVVVAGAAAVVARGAGAGDEAYRVRAIFDNAGFIIPGEDVKVAGVKVGTIDAVEVTPDNRAAIVLDIQSAGFQDFRRDARCRIRPQSLIGERFVECEPTQKRAVGAPLPPPLREIPDGEAGAGQRLLPVEQTDKSVDLDLINNIYRLPYRQRLSIIINEFGAAVAGRGEELAQTIRRANPALRELESVLTILARQNETLTRLAEDSDRALAPLARERRRVSSFIRNAADVGEATAERREALEGTFARLPRFLDELEPTMERLGGLAQEMTPVLGDLGDVAPEVSRFVRGLGPFARAGTPAIDTLGDAARVGLPALEASRPVLRQTAGVAADAVPVADDLSALLTSFEENQGIERLMDFFFYTVNAVNGFDEYGHYLRAALTVNTCSNYATEPVGGCSANFEDDEVPVAASAARAAAGKALGESPAKRTPRAKEPEAAAPAAPTPAPEAGEGAAPSPEDAALLDFLFGEDAP